MKKQATNDEKMQVAKFRERQKVQATEFREQQKAKRKETILKHKEEEKQKKNEMKNLSKKDKLAREKQIKQERHDFSRNLQQLGIFVKRFFFVSFVFLLILDFRFDDDVVDFV